MLTKEEKGKRKTGVRLKDRGGGIGARKGGGTLVRPDMMNGLQAPADANISIVYPAPSVIFIICFGPGCVLLSANERVEPSEESADRCLITTRER